MKKLKYCVIHTSDSSFGNSLLIDSWHKEKGWSKIGYHLVILNGNVKSRQYNPLFDGLLETGRSFDTDDYITKDERGAHVLGYNDVSIGICLIGKNGKYSPMQLDTLANTMKSILKEYPWIEFVGHCDLDSRKPHCPGFDVKEFLKTNVLNSPII